MTRLLTRFSLLVVILLSLAASYSSAQTTAVTAVVVDSGGQVWAGGTISYTFKPNNYVSYPYYWNGAVLPNQYLGNTVIQLDNSGSASFTLPTSVLITPANSAWAFTVCPNASVLCTTVNIPTTGGSQNISSIITSQLLPINITANVLPKAYADAEVSSNATAGAQYYNVTANQPKFYNGTGWQQFGGGITSITTTGTSGPASLTGTILNIPQYGGGGAGCGGLCILSSPSTIQIISTNYATVLNTTFLTGGIDGLDLNITSNFSGYNNGNNGTSNQGWSVNKGHNAQCEYSNVGISNCFGGGNFVKYSPGDNFYAYIYHNSFAGAYASSDEGTGTFAAQLYQLGWMGGNITSLSSTANYGHAPINCHGSNSGNGCAALPVNTGQMFGQGTILLDLSHPGSTFTIASQISIHNSLAYTLSSGSPTVSAAWGNGNSSGCTPNKTATDESYVSTTCTITVLSSGAFYVPAAFSGVSTAGSPNISSVVSTTGLAVGQTLQAPNNAQFPIGTKIQSISGTTVVMNNSAGASQGTASLQVLNDICLSGAASEEAGITAVGTLSGGSQTITFNTRKAWNNGNNFFVMQNATTGGLCGQSFVGAISQPIAYHALGFDGTNLYFASPVKGSTNGQVSLGVKYSAPYVYPGPNSSMTIVRTGGVVTFTQTNGGNLYNFPAGTVFTLSGQTTYPDLNGTFTVTANPMDVNNSYMTWNQSGANESTTFQGSLSLQPTVLTLYPSADITGNNAVSGDFQLAQYNTVPWTIGDAVAESLSSEVQLDMIKYAVGMQTPVDGSQPSFLLQLTDLGPSPVLYALDFSNNSSYGPGAFGIHTTGLYNQLFYSLYRPAQQGCVICIQGSHDSPGVVAYNLVTDINGGMGLNMDPVHNIWTFSGTLKSANSQITFLNSGAYGGENTSTIYSIGGTNVTIQPDASFYMFSGTETIQTITPMIGCNTAAKQVCFLDVLVLSGTVSTATGGNINSVYSFTPGSVHRLYYVNSTSTWYP